MAVTKYFEVRNDSSTTVIDDSFKNLSVTSVANANFQKWRNSSTVYYQQVTVSGNEALVGIHCTSSKFNFAMERRGNTVFIYANVGSSNLSTLNSATKIINYAYDSADSKSGVGLQAYSADGKLVYDSNKKYLRVIDYFNQSVNFGDTMDEFIEADNSSFNRTYFHKAIFLGVFTCSALLTQGTVRSYPVYAGINFITAKSITFGGVIFPSIQMNSKSVTFGKYMSALIANGDNIV